EDFDSTQTQTETAMRGKCKLMHLAGKFAKWREIGEVLSPLFSMAYLRKTGRERSVPPLGNLVGAVHPGCLILSDRTCHENTITLATFASNPDRSSVTAATKGNVIRYLSEQAQSDAGSTKQE